MKKVSIGIITIFTVGFAVFNITQNVSATPDRLKVDICHATSSESNPYVSLNVAQDSVDGNGGNDNGQGDHYLNHPNDIIPPISGIHSGLNWTTEGQAIWNNGCKPHHPTTTTSTSTSTSISTTTSSSTSTFTSTTSTTIPTSSTSSTTSSTTTVPRTTSTTTTVKPNTSTTSTTSTTVAPIVETYVAPAAPISFTG